MYAVGIKIENEPTGSEIYDVKLGEGEKMIETITTLSDNLTKMLVKAGYAVFFTELKPTEEVHKKKIGEKYEQLSIYSIYGICEARIMLFSAEIIKRQFDIPQFVDDDILYAKNPAYRQLKSIQHIQIPATETSCNMEISNMLEEFINI